MNDKELVNRLKQNDQEAFRHLVENYQQMVINTCNSLLHNIEDAEDVAQEVFVEVYRSIDNFRAEARLSTWLYRISVNKSLNHIRGQKINKWISGIGQVFSSNEPVVNTLTDNPENEPQRSMEQKERAVILNRAIDGLPENQRIAFTLSQYEDLSYKEISAVMDVSVSSVESLLFRARRNLRKKLIKAYKNNIL